MKNPKRPTLEQKKVIQAHGLNISSFLVVKNLPDYLEVVKVSDLKKYRSGTSKIRTLKLSR